MGGIFYPTVESELLQSLRKDNAKKLKDIIIKNNLYPDSLYTKRKRTLIQLSCYYLSPKCLSTLLELNYDYNKKEIINDYSPLYIACKFNSLPIVKLLLSKDDCIILQKNRDNYNEFEISFLKGNYDICYYLLYEYKNGQNQEELKDNDNNINNEKDLDINTRTNMIVCKKNTKIKKENKENKEIKDLYKDKVNDLEQPYQKYFLSKDFDLENCIYLQQQNLFPLFNMELFYQSLLDRVPPGKCPSFAAERKRTKELETKIPDPNETWGHFFKRMINFELYNPPMVDKRNVSQMNSMYMNAQMKLMESEYGIKMSYYENEDRNIEDSKQEENEDIPIIHIKKNKKKKNEENNEEQEGQNNNIIRINVKSSLKQSNKNDGNNNNDNNNGNTSVRDKDDFYSIDVNNTSGREMNQNDNNEDKEHNIDNK